ncbi:hypothetical protein E2542_SST28829 [Spatholobus suberectus]|nr:hypothetical protein E2542_SST28829 [Spatholobus suberectus]
MASPTKQKGKGRIGPSPNSPTTQRHSGESGATGSRVWVRGRRSPFQPPMLPSAKSHHRTMLRESEIEFLLREGIGWSLEPDKLEPDLGFDFRTDWCEFGTGLRFRMCNGVGRCASLCAFCVY